MGRNARNVLHQRQRSIGRQSRATEVVEFFNALTRPQLRQTTEALLPGHCERLYPPTVALRCSCARCWLDKWMAVPLPPCPTENLPGAALACAISSCSDFAETDGCPTSTNGAPASSVTGLKSRAGSNGAGPVVHHHLLAQLFAKAWHQQSHHCVRAATWWKGDDHADGFVRPIHGAGLRVAGGCHAQSAGGDQQRGAQDRVHGGSWENGAAAVNIIKKMNKSSCSPCPHCIVSY